MANATGLDSILKGVTGDAALGAVVADWLQWLRDERRSSPHTVDAYVRDLVAFLSFLSQHQGGSTTLADLEALGARDFRAWLARRASAGECPKSTVLPHWSLAIPCGI